MVKISQFLICLGALLVLLNGCGGTRSGSLLSPAERESAQLAPVLGEWKHSSTIFDGINLSLHADKTFTYDAHNCLGLTHTSGTWQIEDDQIVLNSAPSLNADSQGKQPTIYRNPRDTVFFFFENMALKMNRGKLSYFDKTDFLWGIELSK